MVFDKKESNKRYYEKNKERIAERDKEYRKKNKQKIAKRAKKYYEKNKDKVNLYKKEWYKKNRKVILKKRKKYNKDNKEIISKKGKEYRNDPKVRKRQKEYGKNYRKNNRVIIRESDRKNYRENKYEILKRNKEYRINNKEKISKQKKEYRKEYESRIEYKLRRNNNRKQRRKIDKDYLIKDRIRSNFYLSLKKYSETGKIKSLENYGINMKAIIEHLKPFPEDVGNYEVDHIIPLAKFNHNDHEQIKKAWLPSNLQWLRKEINLWKGDRLIIPLTEEQKEKLLKKLQGK